MLVTIIAGVGRELGRSGRRGLSWGLRVGPVRRGWSGAARRATPRAGSRQGWVGCRNFPTQRRKLSRLTECVGFGILAWPRQDGMHWKGIPLCQGPGRRQDAGPGLSFLTRDSHALVFRVPYLVGETEPGSGTSPLPVDFLCPSRTAAYASRRRRPYAAAPRRLRVGLGTRASEATGPTSVNKLDPPAGLPSGRIGHGPPRSGSDCHPLAAPVEERWNSGSAGRAGPNGSASRRAAIGGEKVGALRLAGGCGQQARSQARRNRSRSLLPPSTSPSATSPQPTSQRGGCQSSAISRAPQARAAGLGCERRPTVNGRRWTCGLRVRKARQRFPVPVRARVVRGRCASPRKRGRCRAGVGISALQAA